MQSRSKSFIKHAIRTLEHLTCKKNLSNSGCACELHQSSAPRLWHHTHPSHSTNKRIFSRRHSRGARSLTSATDVNSHTVIGSTRENSRRTVFGDGDLYPLTQTVAYGTSESFDLEDDTVGYLIENDDDADDGHTGDVDGELLSTRDAPPPSSSSGKVFMKLQPDDPVMSATSEFEVLLATGNLQAAQDNLSHLRRSKSVDPIFYDMIFRAYLENDELMMARKTFRLICADHTPTYDSYVLMILCHSLELAAMPDDATKLKRREEKRKKIRSIIRAMQKQGHDLSEVMRRMDLSTAHLNHLCTGVRMVIPDFWPMSEYRLDSGMSRYWHIADGVTDASSRDAGEHDLDRPQGSQLQKKLITEQWKRETAVVVALPLVRTQAKATLAKGQESRQRSARERYLNKLAGSSLIDSNGASRRVRSSSERGTDIVAQSVAAGAFSNPQMMDEAFPLAGCVAPLVDALRKKRSEWIDSGRPQKRGMNSAHRMFVLSDEELASIALAEIDNSVFATDFGCKANDLFLDIGRRIFRQHFVRNSVQQGISEEIHESYPAYFEKMSRDLTLIARDVWADELFNGGVATPDRNMFELQWTTRSMIQVGSELVSVALQSLRANDVDRNEADDAEAMFHTYDFVGGRTSGRIKPNPQLVESRRKKQGSKGTTHKTFQAMQLPMLCVPKPWTGVGSSPYFATPVPLMRCGFDNFQHLSLMSKMHGSTGEVYDALNYLGSCPWRINKDVLQYAVKLFETGAAAEDLAFPAEDVHVPSLSLAERRELPPEERHAFEVARMAGKKLSNETLGLRSDLSYKLTVASAFQNDVFYMPHNMDFRGRTYTVSPYVSHLGNDLSRALLRFGEAKPLGDRGLYWLKVHLANLYGEDKISFDDRVKFVDAHIDDITDSALYPFENPHGDKTKWWRKAGSPWQTLAACIELKAALDSSDPRMYLSTIPVHQDGTCNGLQHYAALGGDVDGAAAVNLAPNTHADRPADVYMAVVDRVNIMLLEHARGDFSNTNFNDFVRKFESDAAVSKIAKELSSRGPIARKTVKQTIMTSVYGVTFIGARDQIYRQLKSLYKDDDDNTLNIMAIYLATCTFQCLDQMFQQAHSIKTWLSDCAFSISKTGAPVSWMTPMNLPVVQPYHKKNINSFELPMQVVTLENGSDVHMPAKAPKQKSAFPPNFVHSLDSTHMMYTANACNDAGVRFVSVHDSYWSHAASIDDMNVLLRKEFVRLHSQPLLDRLYEHFRLYHDGERHLNDLSQVAIEPPPPQGDFDIQTVLKSKYFFN